MSANTRKLVKERPSPGWAVSERRGPAHPVRVALSQLASPVERSCSHTYHLQSHSALQSRQQLLCGLYLSNRNLSQFINKMFSLDCQVPVTSTRQAVISMACESPLIMVILPADSYFCQLYSTRVCGCTQRELPGTMVRGMASSFWSTAQREIKWEECSYRQKGGTAHLHWPWKVFLTPWPSLGKVRPLPFPLFISSPSTKARLSLNFLLSCPQNCSLPGSCAIVSSKKGKTLAVLWVSIPPPAPPSGA